MKKLTFLFLIILLPMMAGAQTLIDGIYYNLNSDTKTAEVTNKPDYYIDGVIIPETVMYDDVAYTVTGIGYQAFFGCRGMTYVNLPSSITYIGEYAFSWCSGLTGIVIPGSVSEIGSNAFYGCTGLFGVELGEGVTSIGYGAFYGCRGINEITFPNSLTTIGGAAFCECSALSSVTIPSSVTSIDDWAFGHCSSLISVTIPKNVQTIGESVFAACTSLNSVIVESGNPNYDSRDNCNAIIETATNTLVAGCHRTIIPNSVTAIGNYAFAYHSEIPSVIIPNGVTVIGNYAFASCSGFTSVTLPGNITSIGESAFRDCTGLTSFVIPNGVTEISNHTFYMCTGLTSVTISGSITSIGQGAFASCTALTDVYCNAGEVPQTARYVFDRVKMADATLYVPEGSTEAYKAVTPWSEFGNIVAWNYIEPEVKKCAMPMIAFFGGKLIIRCKTEGVKYVCNLGFETDGNNVSLPAKVKISVYATKDGYEPSDTLTYEIDPRVLLGIIGDLNNDGVVNGTDIQEVINIIVEGE